MTAKPSPGTATINDAVKLFRDYLDGHDCLDSSTLTRAIYSSDSSIYRVVPQLVAFPRSTDELILVARAAIKAGLPITTRGAGTSCAGNAVGPGLVIDVSRHLNAIKEIDPDAKTAVVEPGVIQDDLQKACAEYGLRFGPDPSTSNRCTIGGMIGNNACGPRALGYGRSGDNVESLTILTGTGEIVTLQKGCVIAGWRQAAPDFANGSSLDRRDGNPVRSANTPAKDRELGAQEIQEPAWAEQLRTIVTGNLGTIRTEFGHFSRQVSGYSLEHLLPERGFDVASFFAGTEGTLGIVLEATVKLVTDAPFKQMIALGYPTMADGADDMETLLRHRPVACEGLDDRIIDVVRNQRGSDYVPQLPSGQAWVFVELTGDDPIELAERAKLLVADSHCLDSEIVTDPARAQRLWKIRADGAGLAGVSLDDPAYPGWEDSAVPPQRLGDYLRDFDALLAEHGMHGLPYGHFGDGCVHCRIDFPLEDHDGPGRYRRFVEDAARLVARYGGSISGEHGDGRARSALLPTTYSPQALNIFAQVKQVFDPENLLNPGVLVDPEPPEDNIRVAAIARSPLRRSHPDFVRQVHQCSGVGKCLANSTQAGQVMCPSYQATKNEKDSTRGRARALEEMVNGSLITKQWRSKEIAEALEYCLACKGCRRDCPTGIDMAAYKSRVLDEKYRRRLRPRSHYTMGMLPRWGRLVTSVPGMSRLANFAMQTPGLKHVLRWFAQVDQRRPMPRFRHGGRQSLALPQTDLVRSRKGLWRKSRPGVSEAASHSTEGLVEKTPVLVWVDSFTDVFEGTALASLIYVLDQAGYAPEVLTETACCGLTWITTGQLNGARKQLRHALDILYPYAEEGVPIIGMEPSCMAVWHSDASELLDDPRVDVVASQMQTLAQALLKAPSWTYPDLSGHTIVAQPHCHHSSVLGWDADQKVLESTGAEIVTLGGCCGLAGNFGVEKGHYELSVMVAEHDLLPALDLHRDAIVLADGFSCRKQVTDLTDRQVQTLAQVLAAHMVEPASS